MSAQGKKVSTYAIVNTAAASDRIMILYNANSASPSVRTISRNNLEGRSSFSYEINGGDTDLTIGLKGHIQIPFSCEIVKAILTINQTGNCVVDIFKCTYAQYDGGVTHPVAGDKITGSAPLTISSNTKANSALTGWTTAIAAEDMLAFNVSSTANVRIATVLLTVRKT
jgi:hypothetical protein